MLAARSTSAAARSVWAGLGHLLRSPAAARRQRDPSSLPVTGMPRLLADAAGGSRCVACHLCVAACPARCIAVEVGVEEVAPASPDRPRRTVAAFTLDVAQCVFCGLCVEACPEQALAISSHRLGPGDRPLSQHPRQAQRFDLEALILTD